MAILVNEQTVCLIQGMTGKEGQRALEWMQASGTKVAAGVTPGKGGQEVLGVPVYNSVAEALEEHPEINTSSAYVPPKFVKSAAVEAVRAGIKLVHIMAEGVPSRDTMAVLELARASGARLLGPSSIGAISPGKAMLGSMGGGNTEQFLAPNPSSSEPKLQAGVVVLSKSGGMANTIANMLALAGIPQSTVIGIGGDRLIGTTYADLLPDIAADGESRAVVIIGEIGGAYEEVLAQTIQDQNFQKPVVAFISGLFAETLPQGVAFGHAGAIVSKSEGSRAGKIAALEAAGVQIAESPTEISDLLSR